MSLPIARLAAALGWLLTALAAHAQDGPPEAAEEALSTLQMRVAPSGREFRAVAPFGDGEFMVASFVLEGETTTATLHRVTANGQIGTAVPLAPPRAHSGSRIDRLVPIGDAMIGIGHVSAGPDDRRGWIVRIEPDFSVSAQTILPIALETQPINYFYGGVLDDRGRLIVAGRSDQPDLPGIGIRFDLLTNGFFRVGLATPNGPASKAGVRANDILLRANGGDLRGLTPKQVLAQLAGDIDTPLNITVMRENAGELDFTINRTMVRGVTAGVVAVLDPLKLDVIEAPKLVLHSTNRAGLQDIGRMPDGHLVGVGWWEALAPDGSTFDKAWIVSLDSGLNVRTDRQFGLDGDNSIAQRLHRQPDGRLVVIGGMHAAPEPLAFAAEVKLPGANAPAELAPLLEHHEGPGSADVFRGITNLTDGSTIVAGAFRSDEDQRYATKAMVLGGDARPRPLFDGCVQSYVWDMASTDTNAIAIAGYCIDNGGQRLAALMWSPPVDIAPADLTLSNAPRLRLAPAGDGQGFDLAEAERVVIFVPAGTPGVLSLSDGSGRLVDFAAVDMARAGLLEADLDPGQYVVNWTSDGDGSLPRIDVMKAALASPETGAGGRDLGPELATALSLLGYTAQDQQQDAPRGIRSMALTRDIAAFQLSVDLPASGRLDITTEITLAVVGALQAEARGNEAAALAMGLSQAEGAEVMASRFGPVAGQWRGEMFVGRAEAGGLTYAGEWQFAEGGQLLPVGHGRLDNGNSREIHAGLFRSGVLSWLGVAETTGGTPTRQVGIFDDTSRFTKGAVFENATLVSSGIFAPGGRTLLRDVPLPR